MVPAGEELRAEPAHVAPQTCRSLNRALRLGRRWLRHDAVMTAPAPRRAPAVQRALMVASWLLAVALATGVAWWAVTAAGGAPRAGGSGVLSQEDVLVELAEQRAAAAGPTAGTTGPPPDPSAEPSTDPGTPMPTAAPTAGPTAPPEPTNAPTTAPPASPDVVRTWDVTGGQVSVSCRAATITLLYATPNDGWTVRTKHAGPEQVEVELTRGEDETRVRAVCVDGTPQSDVDDSGGHGGGSDD